jgi:hypothetical protein
VLTLQQFGVPGLAPCGTGFSATTLQRLGQWKRLYAVLNADAAGTRAQCSIPKQTQLRSRTRRGAAILGEGRRAAQLQNRLLEYELSTSLERLA